MQKDFNEFFSVNDDGALHLRWYIEKQNMKHNIVKGYESGIKLVFDLAYTHIMTKKELSNVAH